MDEFKIVETQYGKVMGVHKKSALNTDYISFQGIPYMKAPLGKLRFREAQPPDKWNHILDAAEESPSYCALNLITRESEGEENAGTISVYTKSIQPKKPFPVMVWVRLEQWGKISLSHNFSYHSLIDLWWRILTWLM